MRIVAVPPHGSARRHRVYLRFVRQCRIEPVVTPAQQKRIARLLTRQGGGGNSNACKAPEYFCGKNDPHARCCSGVCAHGMSYDKCK